MNDMRAVIIPKSDQLNADSLISGPLTITITGVSIRPGTEQPVSIEYDGGEGKPYKPCKSMARVMVTCWGPDANEYVGRSMTLYCDPNVKWGGMEVGGIRISHMTNLKGAHTMALTATKGNKKPFTVKPLVAAPPKDPILDWINGKLAPQIEATDTTEELAKVQQSKAYISATERGTDAHRAEMKRLVDIALLRMDTTTEEDATEVVTETEDDDTFPGDRA